MFEQESCNILATRNILRTLLSHFFNTDITQSRLKNEMSKKLKNEPSSKWNSKNVF